ncbi:uncharacterized protein UTRI_06213 [Ustilago trichophora]|uniref:Effector family protein Eff1 n=1 Tax=Ustilago trichophora TaxID=86804 RepID=A0A5C3EF21_9BASI|nr:uncharacterized protein UTRI_06213 [Ustilago trichophora]
MLHFRTSRFVLLVTFGVASTSAVRPPPGSGLNRGELGPSSSDSPGIGPSGEGRPSSSGSASLRLFGQSITPSSPHDERQAASVPRPASAPVRPPAPPLLPNHRRPVFPRSTKPETDRFEAEVMMLNAVGGETAALPAPYFNQANKEAMVSWSQHALLDPRTRFFYHLATPRKGGQDLYFAKTMPWSNFQEIFPRGNFDQSKFSPIAVYRSRIGLRSRGKVEITGVELVHNVNRGFIGIVHDPVAELGRIFHYLDYGRWPSVL